MNAQAINIGAAAVGVGLFHASATEDPAIARVRARASEMGEEFKA